MAGRPKRATPPSKRKRSVVLTDAQLEWLAANPGKVNVSRAARAGVDQAIRAVRYPLATGGIVVRECNKAWVGWGWER